MTSPGVPELLIILFIVLLFVGTKKLPGLANSIGTSIKEFRRTASDAIEDEDDTDVEDDRGRAPVDGPSPDRDAER